MTEEQELFLKKLKPSIEQLAKAKPLNIKFNKASYGPGLNFCIECLMDQEFSDKVIKVHLKFGVFGALFMDTAYDIVDLCADIHNSAVYNNKAARALARVLYIINHVYRAIQENNQPIRSILEKRPSLRVDTSARGQVSYRENYVEL